MNEHKCCHLHRIDRTHHTKSAASLPSRQLSRHYYRTLLALQNAPRSTVCKYVHSHSDPSQAIQLVSRLFLQNKSQIDSQSSKRHAKTGSNVLWNYDAAISRRYVNQRQYPMPQSELQDSAGDEVQRQRRTNSYVTTICKTEWIYYLQRCSVCLFKTLETHFRFYFFNISLITALHSYYWNHRQNTFSDYTLSSTINH